MRRCFVLPLLVAALWPAAGRAQSEDAIAPWFRQLLDGTGEDERITFRSDFLYWYLTKLRVPPLVTTGPAGSQAVIGDPGTEILRGGGRLTSRHDRYVGERLGGEWWLARGS